MLPPSRWTCTHRSARMTRPAGSQRSPLTLNNGWAPSISYTVLSGWDTHRTCPESVTQFFRITPWAHFHHHPPQKETGRSGKLTLPSLVSLKKKKKVSFCSFSFSFHVDNLKPEIMEISSLVTFLETAHLDVSGKPYTEEILNHELIPHEQTELYALLPFRVYTTPPTLAYTRHTMP